MQTAGPTEQLARMRRDILAGVVTFDFYQTIYLPHAAAAQARAIDALQRVSKGKVSASVMLGAKVASAPLTFRALADSVAVMSEEQLQQFAAQTFDSTSTGE